MSIGVTWRMSRWPEYVQFGLRKAHAENGSSDLGLENAAS